MITVLVKNPGKPARVREIDEKLSTLQELVGGYIEALPTDYDVLLSHIPGICAFCKRSLGFVRYMIPFLFAIAAAVASKYAPLMR